MRRAEIILSKAIKFSSTTLTLEKNDVKRKTHALLLIRKAFIIIFRNDKVEDALRTQVYIHYIYLSEDCQQDLVDVLVNPLISANWTCRWIWKLYVLRFF